MIRRPVGALRPPSPRRLRPVRRRWPLLLLAPLAAWGAMRALGDNPSSDALTPSPTTATTVAPVSTLVSFEAPDGMRTTAARCWMIVIDESSSMSSADRLGTRADAVRATAEFLEAYGLVDDRIGETWFADKADVTPAAATADFVPSAGAHAVGSGTRIAAALTSTFDSMRTSCGDAEPVVVLVSDGQAGSESEFAAIVDLLTGAARDVRVHVVAMNDNQAFEPARPFWEDPALGIQSITSVTSFARDEIAAAVAGILSAETGQQVVAK